jgi:hypothetical protein
MKQTFNLTFTLLIFATVLASCSKKNDALTPAVSTTTLPAAVNNIITAAIIDTLQSHGAVINKGITPPTISGIFLIHPLVCTFDNSGGNFAGKTFADYKYKFSNQDKSSFAIRVDYLATTDASSVLSDSTATFVSGNGNLFTIYSRFNANTNGVNFVIIHILSGEIASGGIKNFQNSTYIVSKDPDPNQYVEPQGATRVFIDADYFSEVQTIFNQAVARVPFLLRTK